MARSRGCRLAGTADDVPGAILTVVGDRWDDKAGFGSPAAGMVPPQKIQGPARGRVFIKKKI